MPASVCSRNAYREQPRVLPCTAPSLYMNISFDAPDSTSLLCPSVRICVCVCVTATWTVQAGHFLVGYLLGVPVAGYSLNLAKEHTDFVEGKLGRSMFVEDLEEQELNVLAVISMAGVAAEGMAFDDVMGQNGDLMDLGRLMRRSKKKLTNAQQQELTRWAAFKACQMIKENDAMYQRLMEAMREGMSVAACIQRMEGV